MSHYRWGCIQKNIICLPERGLCGTGASWHGSQRPAPRGWLWEGWQHPGSPEPASGSACCSGWAGALLWSIPAPAGTLLPEPRLRSQRCWAARGRGKASRVLLWRGFMTSTSFPAECCSQSTAFPVAEYPQILGNFIIMG